jgi:hypothetical protein
MADWKVRMMDQWISVLNRCLRYYEVDVSFWHMRLNQMTPHWNAVVAIW